MRTLEARTTHRVLLFIVLVTAMALVTAASAAGAGKDFVNGGFEDHFGVDRTTERPQPMAGPTVLLC